MSEIDWDKAPEGATHYRNLSGMFYKFSDNSAGRFWSYDLREWLKSGAIKDYEPMVMRPSPAWSGEGLPPVGIDIEVKHELYGWIGARVVGEDGEAALVRTNDGYAGVFPHQFRPIRTPEQIAADERSKAIDEMVKALGMDDPGTAEYIRCGLIYDAGYRKEQK